MLNLRVLKFVDFGPVSVSAMEKTSVRVRVTVRVTVFV